MKKSEVTTLIKQSNNKLMAAFDKKLERLQKLVEKSAVVKTKRKRRTKEEIAAAKKNSEKK